MNNSESGMAKKNIVVRFLAFSLAAIMMLGAFAVVPVLSVESEPEAEQSQSAQNNSEIVYDEDVLIITVDGEERTELEIYENEKVTIKAEGVLAAKYQWQILHPERSGLWVDIYEETKETLDVSLALTSNMEQEDGKTYLRCLAYEAEGAYVTDVLEVATLEGTKPIDAPEIPKLETGKVDYNLVQADGDDHPEFVTVTIKYEKWENQLNLETGEYELEYVGPAFSSYMATIQYGKPFKTTVNNPTIVGFDSYFGDETDPSKSVAIDIDAVTSNVIYTVNYKPAKVKYEIHYFFQNIYDDLYAEDKSIKEPYYGEGYTGLPPTDGIEATAPGFTALYYQPDTIAADGSTVFEVYYERNYYLMEFDCDGGYGVHTIYVRYGTYVSISEPTKPGYIFQGWNLVKTEDLSNVPASSTPIYKNGELIGYNLTDNTIDTIPDEMPRYNTTYKAVWTTTNTTYTVIYWRENADDNNYSYWGSTQINAVSATYVSGSDNIPTDITIATIDGKKVDEKPYFEYNDTLTDKNVLVEGNGSTIVNTYYDRNIYTLNFNVNSNSYGFTAPSIHTHGDDTCVCTKKNHTHGLGCEKTLTCGIEEHTHIAECLTCTTPIHAVHTAECLTCDKEECTSHTDACYSCAHTKHLLSCYSSNGILKESEPEQDIVTNGDGIYTYTTSNGWWNETHYYLYLDGKWYCNYSSYSGYSWIDDTKQITLSCQHNCANDGCPLICHIHSDANLCYKDKIHTEHIASCYKDTEHTHADSCFTWSCGEDDHTHTADCCTKPETQIVTIDGTKYYQIKAKYDQTIGSVWPTAEYFGGVYFRSWKVDEIDSNLVSKRVTMTYDLCDTSDGIKYAKGSTTSDDSETYLYYMFESFDQDSPANGDDRKKYPNNSGAYYDKSDLYYQKVYDTDSLNAKAITGMVPVTSSASASNGKLFLYYKRNRVTFSFYNVSETIETIDDIMYGKPIKDIVHSVNEIDVSISTFIPPYPSTYEPNAYEFGGWYTTPECFPGTEVNWETMTMPNANLEVYAKWTPIVRNVTFYLLYSDVAKGTEYAWQPPEEDEKIKYPIPVPHGQLLGTAYNYIPSRGEDYDFIGWFYFDENGKKKFAPDSMKVTRDLDLFAEWNSKIPTTYDIKYEAWSAKNDVHKIEDIADSLFGYSTAGKTTTFNAKGGEALYDKNSVYNGINYQSHWFPESSSHSILMDEDSTKNTYTFRYFYKDKINYKVVYIRRSDGYILGESEVKSTSEAVVTEKFKAFADHLPESYYIEKAIAYDPTDYTEEGKANHVQPENIIYFYYNEDKSHDPFRVEHWYQNVEDDEYTLMYTENGVADNGEEVPAVPRKTTGFIHKQDKAEIHSYYYDTTNKEWKENPVKYGELTGTVTEHGLEMKLFYDRITVDYTVKYVEFGSDPENVLFSETIGGSKFGSTVEEIAPATYEKDDLDYVYFDAEDELRSKSITIRENASNNVIIFYYNLKKIPVFYHIVCTVPDLDELNGVSVSMQYVAKIDSNVNSTAMAGKGFAFEGWFYDEACTQEVPETWIKDGSTIYPQTLVEDSDGTEHFYALFEPQYGSLEITKYLYDDGSGATGESFLFHIKGQDNNNKHIDMVITITDSGTKTINKIPIGDYKVTEMGDWSYTFNSPREEDPDVVQEATVEQGKTAKATFYRHDIFSDWLTGEDIDVPENNNKND